MTHLSKLFDLQDFNQAIEKKYVRVQTHPDYPNLRIANYTEQTAWERWWNPVTLQCRGIIYDEDLNVLARPFAKFFNHGEQSGEEFSPSDLFNVYDKMDGSLGILYKIDSEYAIATRGSFASEQALWATKFFRETYPDWIPNPSWTYCFEIIYPENRIVVDYGNKRDLVFLGAIDIATGASVDFVEACRTLPYEMDRVMWFMSDATLPQLLSLMEIPKDNFEGYVLHHLASDSRIKLKYEAYKVLHKFMTNTSEKHVWEVIVSGQDPELIFAAAPDEFHDWLKNVIDGLYSEYQKLYIGALNAYEQVKRELPENYTRKDFALAIKDIPFKSILFLLEDNDEERIKVALWQQLKPTGFSTIRTVSNDAN